MGWPGVELAGPLSPEAVGAIDARAALLRQASLVGPDGAATLPASGDRLGTLVATAASSSDEQLDALPELVDDAGGNQPFVLAANLAMTQALHGARGRRVQSDDALITAARGP